MIFSRFLFACGLIIMLFSTAWAQGEFLSSLDKDVTGLVSMVKPSLVTINTNQLIKIGRPGIPGKAGKGDKTFRLEKLSRIGSGVIFDKEGHVITSASVVAGGNDFEVILTNGRKFKGELIGFASDLNLAVLKVEGADLVPARLGNSDRLEAGSWVTILGNSTACPLRSQSVWSMAQDRTGLFR